jgi:hypothetical protein
VSITTEAFQLLNLKESEVSYLILLCVFTCTIESAYLHQLSVTDAAYLRLSRFFRHVTYTLPILAELYFFTSCTIVNTISV